MIKSVSINTIFHEFIWFNWILLVLKLHFHLPSHYSHINLIQSSCASFNNFYLIPLHFHFLYYPVYQTQRHIGSALCVIHMSKIETEIVR